MSDVSAIVLAAGQSRRMGRPKQLLPWGKSTVLGAVLEVVQHVPIQDVIVVLGFAADAIEPLLHDRPGLQVVHNPAFASGMVTSVQVGLAVADPAATGYLLVLGDQPLVGPDIARTLVAHHHPDLILLPTYQGRRGHPILIGSRFRESVGSLSGQEGLRALLWRHPEAIKEVPVPSPAIHIDLDTPEEYARYRPQ